jgi:hypothetical protein
LNGGGSGGESKEPSKLALSLRAKMEEITFARTKNACLTPPSTNMRRLMPPPASGCFSAFACERFQKYIHIAS